ncbi:glycosyltransferase family 2 protein [Candidatus Pelagibacter sp. Uisw_094]|uniref:glycosyltransferase family 2 protein n=1 Tax=Candidatus Pelagibacter sp. Uisw_094 TaxID=3230980 RepID=UPI0039E7ACC7
MNIVIPMAGAGSRFEKAGYTYPKPLIKIKNDPMITLVLQNLNLVGKFIFLVQKDHYDKYSLENILNLIAPRCEIIQLDGLTDGAACTVLKAREFINNNEPLVISNSDQFIGWDSTIAIEKFKTPETDGGILTFKSHHPSHSFAKINRDGYVTEVAEKKPISNDATVGIYYWSKGNEFVKYADQMIKKDIRTNNEFYICPVFNEAIGDGKKIKTYEVDEMWPLGNPEELNRFLDKKLI